MVVQTRYRADRQANGLPESDVITAGGPGCDAPEAMSGPRAGRPDDDDPGLADLSAEDLKFIRRWASDLRKKAGLDTPEHHLSYVRARLKAAAI